MAADAQGTAIRTLDAMIAAERLPPSLLFCGPPGSGKELLAVELAARLNCEHGPSQSCDECPSCAKINNLEHPDVHLIYPVPSREPEKSLPIVIESRREDFFNSGEFGNRARSIGINLTRRIAEALSKQPYEGRHTVVLIFEAHLMTTEAQNAFLKLLEEPPPSAVIILISEFPDRFLPTVLSRCQQLRFVPAGSDVVARFLEAFYSVEPEEARRLSLGAVGNLRKGIKLLDTRFLELRSDAESLIHLAAGGKAKELLGEAESLAHRYTREETEELFGEMVAVLRACMRGNSGGSDPETSVDKTITALLNNKLHEIPADITRINRAGAALKRNADLELTLTQLLLDLAGKWY
jgi:DNA polymerase-3 subunit delta'